MKYDLHLHTNFSACADKNNSYQNLLQLCEKNKLDTISITDHNSCLFHIINMYVDNSKYYTGNIITGMECDTNENGIGFEVLAYGFDPVKILEWTYNTYGTLETRQRKAPKEADLRGAELLAPASKAALLRITRHALTKVRRNLT